MDREALAGLLDRVKAATGADRELDRALAAVFGKVIPWEALAAPDMTALPEWYGDRNRLDSQYLPRLTASIDAALALVERLGWTVHTVHHGLRTWTVGVCRPNDAATGAEHDSFALAILAATLTALLAQEIVK